MFRNVMIAARTLAIVVFIAPLGYALDGGTLRITPRNGWRAFELISKGDNPSADGFDWTLPSKSDGLGPWLLDAATLRIEISHENDNATISEVNVNLPSFRSAIRNTISNGNTGGVSFVNSARQAYGRWSSDGGSSWTTTIDVSNTTFYRFCSAQSYKPNTFGVGRGFVDNLSITGEEGGTNRLFALDLTNRDLYQVSGITGSAPGGIGGLPFDSYENAALLDTGETNHVALVLSPDGGSRTMKLYVGEKGKDVNGNPSDSFLARNGLAYGSHYLFNDALPNSGTSSDGFFDTTTADSLVAGKLEDVDTNPNNPTQVVQGIQETGLFTFDLSLDFSNGSFNAGNSGFSVTKIQEHHNDLDGAFGDADNVDWTATTTLNGTTYDEGLIFVNEDSGTANGETWMMTPNGSGLTLIADTIGLDGSTETSGIVDVSSYVGYKPGSVLLTDNQGANASVSVLINPHAAQVADFDGNGVVDGRDFLLWQRGESPDPLSAADLAVWQGSYGTPALLATSRNISEPSTWVLLSLVMAAGNLARRPRDMSSTR
jgi:hypothetical protein